MRSRAQTAFISTVGPVWALLLCAVIGTANVAAAQSELGRSVVASGAGHVTAGNVTLRSTLGQAFAGASNTSPNVELRAGFWFGGPRSPVSVPSDLGLSTLEFRLHQSFPNPGKSPVVIAFDVVEPTRGRLEIYDVAGGRVRTLFQGSLETGGHRLGWDARSDDGTRLPAGIYFYKLVTSTHQSTKRLILLR